MCQNIGRSLLFPERLENLHAGPDKFGQTWPGSTKTGAKVGGCWLKSVECGWPMCKTWYQMAAERKFGQA